MKKKMKTWIWTGDSENETVAQDNAEGLRLLKRIDETHQEYMAAMTAHTKWAIKRRTSSIANYTINFSQDIGKKRKS